MTVYQRGHIRNIIWIIMMLVVASCTGDAPMPTLARLATATPSPPQNPPTRQVAQAAREVTYPATFTVTPTLTITASPTVTPSATITETSTLTPSPLPTIRPETRPLLGLAEAALRYTALPDDYVVPAYEGYDATLTTPTPAASNSGGIIVIGGSPNSTSAPPPPPPTPTQQQQTVNCAYYPAGEFADVYQNNPDIAQQLGCLNAPAETRTFPAAYQNFQEGMMLWRSDENNIYVLGSSTGDFRQYPDTFQEGVDPEASSETPPDGFFAPRRGFLKVWQNQPGVRQVLGWALQPEQPVTLTVQEFPNGSMLSLPATGQMLVLTGEAQGRWRDY
jgi:hypothetical protein